MKKIAICLLFLWGMKPLAAQTPEEHFQDFLPGVLYVQFAPDKVSVPKTDTRRVPVSLLFPVSRTTEEYGIRSAVSLRFAERRILENTFKIEFDSTDKVASLMERLNRDPRISRVERVPLRRTCSLAGSASGDPFSGVVGNVHVSWHLDKLGYAELKGRYEGNPAIKAAIVDNAVWGGHEDLGILPQNLYNAVSHTEGNADPPSDVNREIIAYPPSNAPLVQAYQWSHGTNCAGLVGAVTGNGTGIASLASGITLMGVRTSATYGTSMDCSIEGVIWAAEHGANVISMSYSGTYKSIVEEEVYRGCAEKGIVMVAAAGNENRQIEIYPACYPGVISVGSVNYDGKRSSFSNYGDYVDVWAPGGYYVENDSVRDLECIFSTVWCVNQLHGYEEPFAGTYYDAMAGTSMATPLVSSAAALLLSYHPDLNGYQMKEVLQRSSRDSCIYLPAAFAFLEEDGIRQVRDLYAAWNGEEKTVEMRWKEPEKEGVVLYRIYHGENIVGETVSSAGFSFPLTDTTGFWGVRAVYAQDSGMTVYTRVCGSLPTVTEYVPQENEVLNVQVNHKERTIKLITDEIFDRIEIYDIRGTRVCEIPGGQKSIDMRGFARGLYIGKTVRGTKIKTFKIIL